MSEFLSTATLPDEYQQLANTVRDFARTVVAPVSAKHDAEHSFPYEVVAGMAEMGLFGLPFPEEYGGMGGDYFALCLALEELAKVDQSVAITLEGGVSLGAMPVYKFGNDAQKREWLPQLTSGRALGAFGLTEAGGGTDAGATRTTAVLDDGHWVINGSKQFITNSGTDITKLVTVTAVTGSSGGAARSRRSWCPYPPRIRRRTGLQQSRLECLRHPSAVVHRRSGCPRRICSASGARLRELSEHPGRRPGCDRRAVHRRRAGMRRRVREIRGERAAFGQPIGRFQAIEFKIARMEARAHAARTAYYDAAALMLAGKPFKKQAAIAKTGLQ